VYDTLQYDVESLFPNLNRDLRTREILSEDDEFMMVSPKVQPRIFNGKELLVNCKSFLKIDWNRAIAVCKDSFIMQFSIDPMTQTVAAQFVFAEDLNNTTPVSAIAFEGYTNSYFVNWVSYSTLPDMPGLTSFFNIVIYYPHAGPDWKFKFTLPSRGKVKLGAKIQMKVSNFQETTRLLIFNHSNPETEPSCLGFTFLTYIKKATNIDETEGIVLEPEAEWTSKMCSQDMMPKVPSGAPPLKLIKNVNPKSTLLRVEEVDNGIHLILLERSRNANSYNIYLQACNFDRVGELSCDYETFNLGMIYDSEVNQAASFFAGYYYHINLNLGDGPVQQIITMTQTYIICWDLDEFGGLQKRTQISLRYLSLSFIEISTMIVDADDKFYAVVQKDENLFFVIEANFETKVVRALRDTLKGNTFTFFKDGTKGSETTIVSYYTSRSDDYDSVPIMYYYSIQRQLINSNLDIYFSSWSTSPRKSLTFLASNDDFITFNLEVIRDLTQLDCKSAWKDMTFYRDTEETSLYLPYEIVNFRASSPVLALADAGNNHYELDMKDTHFVEGDEIEYMGPIEKGPRPLKNNYLESIVRLTNITLTHENFTMHYKKDGTIDVFACIGMNTRKLVRCYEILTNFSIAIPSPENYTVTDFYAHFGLFDMFQIFIVGSDSLKTITYFDIIRKEPFQAPRFVKRQKFDKPLLFSSMKTNTTHLLLYGIGRIGIPNEERLFRDYLSYLILDLRTLNFTKKLCELNEIYLEQVRVPVEDFSRYSYIGFIVTKKKGDALFVYNYTYFPGDDHPKNSMLTINTKNFKKLGLSKNMLLMQDMMLGKIFTWSKPIGVGEESRYYEIPIKDTNEVLLLSRTAKIGIVYSNDMLLALEIGGSNSDPLHRYSQSLTPRCKIPDPSDTKLKAELWMMGHSYFFTVYGILIIKDVSGTEPKINCSTSIIYDIFGPNYLLYLKFGEMTSRNAGIKYLLSSPTLTYNFQTSFKKINFKSYCKQIVAGPRPSPLRQLTDFSSKYLEYNIQDLVEVNSHVSHYEIEQYLPVGEIVQPIIKISPSDPRIAAVPDRVMMPGESGELYQNFFLIFSKKNLEIIRIADRSERKYIQSVSLLNVTLDFNYTAYFVPEPFSSTFDFINVFFLVPEDFGAFTVITYVFRAQSPKDYVQGRGDWLLPSSNLTLQPLSEDLVTMRYSLVYLSQEENSNSLVTGILYLRMAKEETTTLKRVLINFTDRIYSQKVPYRIISFNMLFSDKALLQYFFIQNSGYIGIIFLRFNKVYLLEESNYGLVQFSSEIVLNRNSQINCLSFPQELSLSCIFYSPADRSRIFHSNFMFNLGSRGMAIPRSDYTLSIPGEYTIRTLYKGYKMDIVLAKDEFNRDCLLFYNITTGLVFQEMCEEKFPTGFLKNHPDFNQISPSTFILASPGHNARDMVYERVDPKLRIYSDYYQGQIDYLGYRLVIKGLFDGDKFSDKIPLHDLFALKTRPDWVVGLLFLGVFLFLMTTSIWLCVYANRSNKLFTKPPKKSGTFDETKATRKGSTQNLNGSFMN